MSAIWFVVIVAAAICLFGAGVIEGEKEGRKQMLRLIEQASHKEMVSGGAFVKSYGRSGFYFHKLHPELDAGPLAVISSADFLKLIAIEQLGQEATPENLQETIDQLSDSYHLASGYTHEKLAFMKNIRNGHLKNESDS